MVISMLQMSLSIPIPSPGNLSSSSWVGSNPFLTSKFSHLSLAKPPKPTPIRMGGGPRTFPGGVSKWQWKRMQAKKAKQLLRARLARERQLYEMRKRAELTAAVSELERPWEVVEKAPKLFSASADEQLKVLADRFQKPGGFDLWSEKDGPQLFESVDGIPSSRFFPKGVVHSIKPYGELTDGDSGPGTPHRNGSDDNSKNSNGKFKKIEKLRRIGTADSSLGHRNGYDENSRNASEGFNENGNRRIGSRFWDDDMGQESGLGQRNGYDQNSRNSNGKLMKIGNLRSNGTADSGLGQEIGYDENSRNASEGFNENGNRRIGSHFRDEDMGHRNGYDPNSRNSSEKFNKNRNPRRTGYQFSDEDSGPNPVSGQRNGYDENSRNPNEKLQKNGNRRIGSNQRNLHENSRNANGKTMKNANRRTGVADGFDQRRNGRKSATASNSKVCDMNLQDDGSYGILNKEMGTVESSRRVGRN